jgi:hypothetical protein
MRSNGWRLSSASRTPTLAEFLQLPAHEVYEQVYDKQLGVSLLLNGTRRWYIANTFDQPPQDNSYFPHYLETVLERLGQLIQMLSEHGIYRVFMPVYSWYQSARNPQAHKYLMKGIEALTRHPYLTNIYREHGYRLWFYGDTSFLPPETAEIMGQAYHFHRGTPEHYLYFGVDGGNPYNYSLRMAYQFGLQHGHPPTWEDMVEMYYGDRTLKRLEILIGFNRIYSRGGIPHLLEGGDRIYTTVVTPLTLSQDALRTILHDYLYNRHDFGRDYKDIHPNEIVRLKQFYDANQNTILGLMRKYEDLVYPVARVNWPEIMELEPEPIYS